ncbi:MAG: nuclear transport factor 2 family protein [Dehalococcoidales bacterium]|jgi:ketosteroid isomerase-like protein
MAAAANKTAEQVLKHHEQALLARDLRGIVEDYTGDSVFLTANGAFRGTESIKQAYRAVLATLTPEVLGNMKVIKQEVSGEYVLLIWSAPPQVSFGTDSFHIRDGKIMMQSVATR